MGFVSVAYCGLSQGRRGIEDITRLKARFGGEFFPMELPELSSGMIFVEFFQSDRETGDPKGIVAIDL
jgi:hypothetical protein